MAVELTEVVVHAGNVQAQVFTKSDLERDSNPTGSIKIHDGYVYTEEVFWNNLDYFQELNNEKIEECVQELKEKNQYYPGVIEDIISVVKRLNDLELT